MTQGFQKGIIAAGDGSAGGYVALHHWKRESIKLRDPAEKIESHDINQIPKEDKEEKLN